MQHLHQLFKGHILMLMSCERGLFDLFEQVSEGQVICQFCSQHECFDKTTDQPLCLYSLSPCNGYTHQKVLLLACVSQYNLPSSQQGHEHGDAFSATQIRHAPHELWREAEVKPRSAMAF